MKLLLFIIAIIIGLSEAQLNSRKIILKFDPLKICLRGTSGLTKFGYHANVNFVINEGDVGQVYGETDKRIRGQWCLTSDYKIEPGEDVNYYVYAEKDGKRMTSEILTKRKPRKNGWGRGPNINIRIDDYDE